MTGSRALALLLILLASGCLDSDAGTEAGVDVPPPAPDPVPLAQPEPAEPEPADPAPTEPSSEAPAEPEPEEWFMSSSSEGGERVRRLTREPMGETSASWPYGGTLDRQEYGPFVATEPSQGATPGPGEGFVTYACQHPAEMAFTMEVRGDGRLLGQGKFNETFIGSAFPVPFLRTISIPLAFPEGVLEGVILEATYTVEGCTLLMMGSGGDWSQGFRFL